MKACISLYSYWKLVKVGKMTHYDALDEMKRIGAEAVELQVFSASVPEGKSISDYIRDLHAYAVKIGLEVPMLTMCANLYGPTADNDLAFLCELTDILPECGVGFLRSDVTYSFLGNEPCRSYKTIIRSVTPYIRKLADYAEKKGVVLCTENHGLIMQDSGRLEELFSAVNHENFRFLCDMGNFTDADEDCAAAVSALLPHICYVHAKDFFLRSGMAYNPGTGFSRTRGGNYTRATIFGHGDVPTYQILRALRSFGYDGYVSLEFEGIEDPIMANEIGLANLCRMIGDLEK